jgi:oxygen-independent coproporphyrinogen-3 oxidase
MLNIKMPDNINKYINPVDIPAAYLEKYQRSGPRYTSYPTAPQFKTGFSTDTITALWAETNNNGKAGLSLYSHFPFCKTRCLYCGCYTNTDQPQDVKEQYVEAMKREADRLFTIISPSRKVHQLAFGGGTPTYLSVELLTGYMNHLGRIIGFSDDAERSIEVDPRSVDEGYLQQLLDLGFNRFSFGVQDLDPLVQRNINRVVEEEKLTALLDYLRQQDLEAINLDLIYGLPGQSPASFSATVEKIVALRPSRIALFGYAHVPWVSPHQKEIEKFSIPNTEERMVLFGTAFDLLVKAGYSHIGMDHFALADDELVLALKNRTLTRNFMGYTTRRGLDLVGIGVSSISSVGTSYAQNSKDIHGYINNSNGLHWMKALVLTPEDRLRREIILNLFCNFYLDTEAVAKKFAISFKDHFAAELKALKPFETDGLLLVRDNELMVTEMGRFFIRNICMTFDQYLAKDKQGPEKRYSKTL